MKVSSTVMTATRLAAQGVLMLGSLTIALGLLEGLLHLTPLKRRYLPPVEPQGYVSTDVAIGYDITPNFPEKKLSFTDGVFPVWSNNIGCFDVPYQKTTSSIYLTGDSFTWGWVPLAENWGKAMESSLHTRVLTIPSSVVCDSLVSPPYEKTPAALCSSPTPILGLAQMMKATLGTHSVLYSMARRTLHVDLLPAFRKEESLPSKLLYWAIDGHWSGPGNALASRIVAQYIEEHRLLPVSVETQGR